MKRVILAMATAATLAVTLPAIADNAHAAAPAAKAEAKPVKMVKKHHAPSAHVKALQEALNKHGAKLKADGYWGHKTVRAVRAFQKENKLKVTGHADKATKKALGLS